MSACGERGTPGGALLFVGISGRAIYERSAREGPRGGGGRRGDGVWDVDLSVGGLGVRAGIIERVRGCRGAGSVLKHARVISKIFGR